jgi:hypothetical protein
MCTVFPVIVDPDWLVPLATITPMRVGTVSGGGGLLPGLVDHPAPQAGGWAVRFAKPLKLDGAGWPFRNWLFFAHWLPQK